jgi:hypothetical protein
MKYSNEEIKKSIIEFLGEKGNEYFQNLKDEYGTCWVRENIDGWSVSNWTHEGRQIRNHVIDKFSGIVEELGDYEDFEDFIYTIVEEIFE